MRKTTIKCFDVREDSWGDAGSKHMYYVSSEELGMELVAKNKMLTVRPFTAEFIVYDTMSEIEQGDKNAIITGALAKLTPAEREALGLDRGSIKQLPKIADLLNDEEGSKAGWYGS